MPLATDIVSEQFDISLNSFSNFDETYRKCSTASLMTGLDFGCQRSKVKVTAGRHRGKGINIDVRVSKFIS